MPLRALPPHLYFTPRQLFANRRIEPARLRAALDNFLTLARVFRGTLVLRGRSAAASEMDRASKTVKLNRISNTGTILVLRLIGMNAMTFAKYNLFTAFGSTRGPR